MIATFQATDHWWAVLAICVAVLAPAWGACIALWINDKRRARNVPPQKKS